MRLVISGDRFNLYSCNSESELQEYIKANDGLIIGNDIQYKNRFYIVEFLTSHVKNVVGILNEGHGLRPVIIKLENTNVVVLSSDKLVYFLNIEDNRIIKTIVYDSLVYDIVLKENIFIVCELGIQSITPSGNIVWTYDSDSITDFTFFDSYIRVATEDTVQLISFQNGKEIQS